MPAKPQGHDTRYVKMQKNNCFVCGMNNPEGMRLKFILDETSQTFICRFRLGKRYTGPPGHCHGGIIACILDDAMGKVNKLHQVIALTREMTVEYLKPVPLHKPLRVEGREIKVEGRTHINAAEILNEKDEVLARSRGTFIAIDPAKMFVALHPSEQDPELPSMILVILAKSAAESYQQNSRRRWASPRMSPELADLR